MIFISILLYYNALKHNVVKRYLKKKLVFIYSVFNVHSNIYCITYREIYQVINIKLLQLVFNLYNCRSIAWLRE